MARVFFTDRDLGKGFPGLLAEAGLAVRRHDDLFRPETLDTEWLEHCGTNDWIAITHNERIRYVPNELAAVRTYRVKLLVVVGKVRLSELARNFLATRGAIESFVDMHDGPLIAKVYRPSAGEMARDANAAGSVRLWYPKS